jgi:hypothetical protein
MPICEIALDFDILEAPQASELHHELLQIRLHKSSDRLRSHEGQRPSGGSIPQGLLDSRAFVVLSADWLRRVARFCTDMSCDCSSLPLLSGSRMPKSGLRIGRSGASQHWNSSLPRRWHVEEMKIDDHSRLSPRLLYWTLQPDLFPLV